MINLLIHAQVIKLKVTENGTNFPVDDADVYFSNSTKNYFTDLDGVASIDLSQIKSDEFLVVSKKEYDDVKVKVSDLKSLTNVKLSKVSVIELNEAVVKNLSVKEIIQKTIDNYSKNFNVDQYYFLANLRQDVKIDSNYYDILDVDLQFKFDQEKVKIKSTGKVNDRFIKGFTDVNINFDASDYLKHLYSYKNLNTLQKNLAEKKYTNVKSVITRYADKSMYEVYLDEGEKTKNYLLIDKETFSVVEYVLTLKNVEETNRAGTLNRNGTISFKYRPYLDGWVLKESDVKYLMTFSNTYRNKMNIDLDFKIKTFDFSTKTFDKYKRNVNIKSDIRNNF